jgi:ribosomal-protein-alanine N-acetyltransferase
MPENGPIDFEPMWAEDVPQVLEIEREAFDDPWQTEHFLHELLVNPYSGSYCLRRQDGRIEAYACVWIVDRDLLINNIAVRREARRQGLGRRLLDQLLETGRSRGCRTVRLDVRPSNRPAVELYRRAGFRVAGVRPRYYAGSEDGWVMTLDLSGGHRRPRRAVLEGKTEQ